MKNITLLCKLCRLTGIAIVLCIILTGLVACKSHPTEKPPLPVQKVTPVPPPVVKETEPAPPAPPEPLPQIPYNTNWKNTTWIIREPANSQAKTWPGYKGFHLASDGNLMLINMDTAIGNRWQDYDNTLTLQLLNGKPDFPLEGTFHTYQMDNSEKTTDMILLVPVTHLDSAGIVLEKATIAIDIIENHWIPRILNNSENIRWPMGKDIHLLFLPNGRGGINAIGYGGVNRFDGPAYIDTEKISMNPIPITGKTGEDSNFENLFFQHLKQTSYYVQIDKDMFFYKKTVPLVAFNAQLFN